MESKRHYLYIALIFLFPGLSHAAPPTRQATYTSGQTILSADVTANENALFNYLQAGVDTYSDGSIVNADISASANIQSDKLNLTSIAQNISNTGTFTNTGNATVTGTLSVSSTATVAGGIINTAIGASSPSTGAFTTLSMSSSNQGDVYYDNGSTGLTRLTPGTSGQVLKTLGAGANPAWVNSIAGFYDYGTSASASTTRQGTATYVAAGNTSVGANSTQAITNLPFNASTSYYVVCTYTSSTAVNENCLATPSSGSSFTLKNDQSSSRSIQWIAVGI